MIFIYSINLIFGYKPIYQLKVLKHTNSSTSSVLLF